MGTLPTCENTAINEAPCVAILTVERADGSPWLLGRQIQIFAGKDISIGRVRGESALQIQSDYVSKRHFRIYSVIYDDEKLSEFPPFIYCQDLGSTNGTYIDELLIGNERLVGSPRILNNGDVISIRPYWFFRFHQKLDNQRGFDSVQTKEIELFKDRYNISNRLLGEGGCSVVHLATEVSSKWQVACKIVDLKRFSHGRSKCDTEKAGEATDERAKLIREIEFLSKLNHPNIATLYKAFRSEHSLYIFNELACGGDLFSFVQARGGSIGDLDTCVIIRQVTIAVAYLHSNGVVHRDLKPDNILIMHAGIGHRVVLTDFGYANYIGSSSGRMTSQVGTRDYVAPEVHKKEEKGYTKAVDMWSLGIVTLSLFTGDTHFKFKELRELGQGTITARITNALHNPWVQISNRARDFIEKLLVFDPEQRMLAIEAVEHGWFRRPDSPGVAVKLDELLERANKYWWKRADSINLIECLPDVTLAERKGSSTHNIYQQGRRKTQRKMPDATALPYFGLDRHLQNPEAVSSSILNSKRQRLLANLIETDSKFLDTGVQDREQGIIIESRKMGVFKPPANMDRRRKQTKTVTNNLVLRSLSSTFHSQNPVTARCIREVDATDLFGTMQGVAENCFSSLSQLKFNPTLREKNDIGMEKDVKILSRGIEKHNDQNLNELRELAYEHTPSQVPGIDDLSSTYGALYGRKNNESTSSIRTIASKGKSLYS